MKATVSGSFHRHMVEVYRVVCDLVDRGVEVLSPADPRIVDDIDGFPFVASDVLRSIKLVQDRHLQAILASDFLWVVSPDGHAGVSVCMEIGCARASGIPVYSVSAVRDPTVDIYITRVSSLDEAILHTRSSGRVAAPASHVLLDPSAATERLHAILDRVGALSRRGGEQGSPQMRASLVEVATEVESTVYGL